LLKKTAFTPNSGTCNPTASSRNNLIFLCHTRAHSAKRVRPGYPNKWYYHICHSCTTGATIL
jgi:hypothetical protein